MNFEVIKFILIRVVIKYKVSNFELANSKFKNLLEFLQKQFQVPQMRKMYLVYYPENS